MKKRTKRIIFLSLIAAVFIAIVTAIVLIAVNFSRNPFVGEWESIKNKTSYTFYEDGSVKVYLDNEKVPVLNTNYTGTVEGEYAYDKGEDALSLTMNVYSKKITRNYTYEIEDDTLILTENKTNNEMKFLYVEKKQ